MSAASVLYDAPGPRAKARNLVLTIIFAILVAGTLWWAIDILAGTDQLDGDKWNPFLTAGVWTTYLLPGLAATLEAAFYALIGSLVLGAVLALGRLSDHVWVRLPAAWVVELFRSIPVLVMMIFFKQLYVDIDLGTPDQRPLFAVVTGLVLYNGSVLAEVFRAGILSLPNGQTEASKAIGLRKGQMMRLILLPQGFTAMLPATVSQLVVIVKDTALGSIILYPELLAAGRQMTTQYGNPVATYVGLALIFVLVNFILTSLAGFLDKFMNRKRRGPKIDITQAAGGLGGSNIVVQSASAV
ncbi:amino acid ABC transporter permease [Nakamurella sp. A5-74]|uniref:Amino acid ABC transporter permease n=1 Tax=Nakamurella sp. A5-74 TaxID=3158264 RepID=A0AAU8DMB6_9ACTN